MGLNIFPQALLQQMQFIFPASRQQCLKKHKTAANSFFYIYRVILITYSKSKNQVRLNSR